MPLPQPGGRRPVARLALGRAVGACQPLSHNVWRSGRPVAPLPYGPFCSVIRAVLQCRTARFVLPNGMCGQPAGTQLLCVPGRRALCGVAAEVAAGLRCSGRRLASVGRTCTAGLGETGVMQGVGAYSGKARLPACIKIMCVGLAVAWRLVAMSASVCPAWNIERRLNIFFPAPCPAFD